MKAAEQPRGRAGGFFFLVCFSPLEGKKKVKTAIPPGSREKMDVEVAAAAARHAEEKGDPSPPGGFQLYKRRWLVLVAVCLLNCSNAMVGKGRRGGGRFLGSPRCLLSRPVVSAAPVDSASRDSPAKSTPWNQRACAGIILHRIARLN